MHRFHLPPEQCRGSTFTLTDGEAHHAARVLRVQPGERVTVLDGAGGEFHCEVGAVTKREVPLRVLEKKVHSAPPWQITLLLAVPKGKIIESIIEKATELGARRILPLLTQRVTTRLEEDDAAEKSAKWQHVAIEAIKQCGAAWLPKVERPLALRDALARDERFDLALVGALQGEARHPREFFRAYELQRGARPRSVAIWIGPEGDFTPEELAAIQDVGAKPITLGPLVLRVETAAIYCLSFLNYELRSA
jgi:16S rRNA (uracil1498-N3)-methyltransferase